MAGLSSRFSMAGFSLPKYMLYIYEDSVFSLSVSSFSSYFQTAKFIFVARSIFDTAQFIKKECDKMGILNYEIILIEKPTQGQAETVLYGVNKASLGGDEPMIIFNIDTFRPKFKYPENIESWDGYLEVFHGSGSNWSYAKTESDESNKVVKTTEKREISKNCSTGLYYFKRVDFFTESMKNLNSQNQEELYVAPLFNYLIEEGRDIRINKINRDQVIFCGIPEEYISCLDSKGL